MNARSSILLRDICACAAALYCLMSAGHAATFSGNALVEVSDPNGELTWNTERGALTVSCWFRISISSTQTPPDNMIILANRPNGGQYAYRIQFNLQNGNVEFVIRHPSDGIVRNLIERPYLERWYHVAVTRLGNAIAGFVDGRRVFGESISSAFDTVGSKEGVTIGGQEQAYFTGDIQEVAIYQAALAPGDIRTRMFSDQRTNDNLRGYYKLGFSTNNFDHLKNFALSPAPGSDPARALPNKDNLGFEETDQAGEQSTFDSRKNKGLDALVPLSGAFSWSQTALSRPTPGIAFDFQFGYSSAIPVSGQSSEAFDKRTLGPGWRHTFDARLVQGESSTVLNLITWDGATEVWDRSPTNTAIFYTRHKEYRGELIKLVDGTDDHEWITPERLVYRFRNPLSGNENMDGRLLQIRDFNSHSVRLLWNEGEGYVLQAFDTAGGRFDFKYDVSKKLLTNVSFHAWSVDFGYDSSSRLIRKSVTNTSILYANARTTWQFGYNSSNSLLQSIIDPRDFTNRFVQYDRYGRKTNELDALGRATRTEYGVPGKRQIRHSDPGSFRWIEEYDRKHRLLVQTDPRTNTTRYGYDERGNRTSITEPLGWKTTLGYDDRANVIARTNALGEVTGWVFHSNSIAGLPHFNKPIQEITPQPTNVNGEAFWTNYYDLDDRTGNLRRHSDNIGTLVSYTYNSNGLVQTSTDANSNITRFGYDTNGFLVARTNAANHTWSYTYNDVGWKQSERNPNSETTSYSLDLNGNVVLTVDALGRRFTKTYDGNGNLLTSSDAKDKLTIYAYDAGNQRTSILDRASNVWSYVYSSRGKLERSIDPLKNTLTNFYDAANRLERVSDPLGNISTNNYDGNGNLVAFFDKVAQRWSKTYDRLNRVIAESDPLGNTRRTTYDSAGRIKEVFTPNNYPSTHSYDGRGRLSKWVDAENFEWKYDYDGVGNITNITDALNGRYVMSYGNRNERILERNQDEFEWRYEYDRLLRLTFQRDPNGTERRLGYDRGGRLRSVQFSTGRTNTLEPDDNDNLRTVTREMADVFVTTTITYDRLDRPTQVEDDVTGQIVGYNYDALGRITALTYPGGKILTNSFDALGRLTNQVDWGNRQITYAYDKADRLIRRTYPNGVVQTNTFDNAGHITSLSYSPLYPQPSTNNAIQIALTYAYDRNGNKTESTEHGTLNWRTPLLTDETSRFSASGRVTNREVTSVPGSAGASPNGIWSYNYDASGNMTNAADGAQIYALTYDEDNRTTSIACTTNGVSTTITNRYDALGRRISRTKNGVETRYVLDLSGTMERILCDTDSNGSITAYYIHPRSRLELQGGRFQ